MAEYKIETDEIEIILTHLMSVYKDVWKNTNFVSFSKGKTKLGSIDLKSKTKKGEPQNMFKVTGAELNTLIKKLIKQIKDKDKNKVTDDKLNASIFKNFSLNKHMFGELEYNKDMFLGIDKQLKSVGIDKVEQTKTYSLTQTITNNMTLAIEASPACDAGKTAESGFYNRLRDFLFNDCNTKFENKDQISLHQRNWFSLMTKEKQTDIIMKGMLVGHYFPERNFISLYFNPFALNSITIFDVKMPEVIMELIKTLKGMKIKKTDVSTIAEKLFLEEFLKNSNKRKQQLKQDIQNLAGNITNHENSLRHFIEDVVAKRQEVDAIETNIETQGKGIFKELDLARKLSFIEKIELGTAEIKIKYVPTIISIPKLSANGHSSLGKRYAYIGSLTLTIKPGAITVSSDAKMSNGSPHPHVSTGGGPCFGSGNGYDKIFGSLASNRFCDLSKLLWFWIHIYRDDAAYHHSNTFYKDRLTNGYPVFSAKKERIELGDVDDIKTGAQTKEMTKTDNYEKNHKKYGKISFAKLGGN